ncbi:phospholipase B1, membrane-associated [Austrofundulus limnaeus]|uniref:Phospholipase B1, membrane-associated n=1 Tax=Austrofundulus limnaeus TaxID=52670 RepID=A0A2I4CT56_AUSLI|nr:PREDICTED: phospholipase B1, membrane-associated-like [Austrofundulus limnaeus]
MMHYEGLNFKEDWKLLTILIGMNDICGYCGDKAHFSANNYIDRITHSLDMLMDKVPRMIVNMVQIMPLQLLREMRKPFTQCPLLRFTCQCMTTTKSDSPELYELVEVNLEYQKRLEEVLSSGRFFKKDFAVVLQPFLMHTSVPRKPNGKVDLTYFSLDCFHLSVKGHEELAKGLWNNMFEPVGQKTTVRSYPTRLRCPPAEHPYIYTRPQ